MNVRHTAQKQYQAIIDHTARQLGQQLAVPREGWIATVRKGLGMSGAQLSKRLGVTRARISKLEQAEGEGGVTLKTMHAVAEALGCRFVYAIVPVGRIEDILREQARRKAQALVRRASTHMALESQSLSEAQNAEEVERIAQDLLHTMPADLWAEK